MVPASTADGWSLKEGTLGWLSTLRASLRFVRFGD
jgi:hypothetical protein